MVVSEGETGGGPGRGDRQQRLSTIAASPLELDFDNRMPIWSAIVQEHLRPSYLGPPRMGRARKAKTTTSSAAIRERTLMIRWPAIAVLSHLRTSFRGFNARSTANIWNMDCPITAHEVIVMSGGKIMVGSREVVEDAGRQAPVWNRDCAITAHKAIMLPGWKIEREVMDDAANQIAVMDITGNVTVCEGRVLPGGKIMVGRYSI
ncbi:hypothetical protein MMC30_005645 [Trapelia coarctata]|nr:hypothetical protein [Trapelia coarctata]